nr:MAG TPA: hypothetical protein [Caudoviricetes sp.]
MIGFANTNIHLSGVCFRIYKRRWRARFLLEKGA